MPGARATETAAPDAPNDDAAGEVGPTETLEVLAPLLQPRDGIPAVVQNPAALASAIASLAAADGPVAVDAERASGYRYGQRAYLVQLRRDGAPSVLIDPIACPDLSELDTALADAEWVVHAASQDLACLAELGLRPRRLFDTELGGRLAGLDRVGLGPMVTALLGVRLEKGYSAADWSQRPLPEPWLHYAVLDVEVLVELRDALEAMLREQGKLDWAHEEFEAVRTAPPPPPRIDPWRRTSGIHRLRSRRQLAIVRALWQARDRVAREEDVSPSRLLPDSALMAATIAAPVSRSALAALAGFTGRGSRRHLRQWWAALEAAQQLPDAELPELSAASDALPPVGRWADREPLAAARLTAVRAAVVSIAEQHHLPAENLLPPEAVRRLAWASMTSITEAGVTSVLRAHGARSWQVRLTADALADALINASTADPVALGG